MKTDNNDYYIFFEIANKVKLSSKQLKKIKNISGIVKKIANKDRLFTGQQ